MRCIEFLLNKWSCSGQGLSICMSSLLRGDECLFIAREFLPLRGSVPPEVRPRCTYKNDGVGETFRHALQDELF